MEIRDGLAVGDKVVTAGKVALRDGTAVQVIGDKPATAVASKAAPAKAETRQ